MGLNYEPTLFTKDELTNITKGEWLQNEPKDLAVKGLFISPELYNPQHIFIATGGFSVQKRKDYVLNILKKGVIVAIIDEKIKNIPSWSSILLVKNTQQALEELSHAARERSMAKIIAITGSVGKTSIKDTLCQILSAQDTTFCSYKSVNGGVGLKNQMAILPKDVRYGIFEIGMLGPNSIKPRTLYIKPDVALINSIAPAHIGYHTDIKSIIKSKTDIIYGLNDGGSVVVPRDSEFFEEISAICKNYKKNINIITFGENEHSNCRLINFSHNGIGSYVKAVILGKEIEYNIGISGKFWALNSVAVLACVRLIGADIFKASQIFEFLQPSIRRGERFRIEINPNNIIEIIDDTFNANPASMSCAIKLLNDINKPKKGRKILVIGDMEDLGKDEIKYHCDLSLLIQNTNIDLVFTVGDKMKYLFEKLPDNKKGFCFKNSILMANKLKDFLKNGDLVLVKGSNKTAMNKIVNRFLSNNKEQYRVPARWTLQKELDG